MKEVIDVMKAENVEAITLR
jgi:hypothetical protein